jgi:hypothetical protein
MNWPPFLFRFREGLFSHRLGRELRTLLHGPLASVVPDRLVCRHDVLLEMPIGATSADSPTLPTGLRAQAETCRLAITAVDDICRLSKLAATWAGSSQKPHAARRGYRELPADGHDHRPLQVRTVVTPLGRRVAVAFGYMAAVLLTMLLVEALVDLWRYLL